MRLRQAYRRDTALTLDKVFRLNHETRKDDKVQWKKKTSLTRSTTVSLQMPRNIWIPRYLSDVGEKHHRLT